MEKKKPVKEKVKEKAAAVKAKLKGSKPAAAKCCAAADRKSTRLNSSHPTTSRMPSSA